MPFPVILGVDFDNTIVSYDDVMCHEALKQGWITKGTLKNKKEIRDAIRQIPNGEIKWQRLQSFVYGYAMDQAKLIKGVKKFFRACINRGIKIYIISHKTQHARMDDRKKDLRKTALLWMKDRGFFKREGLGLTRKKVFFEPTRQAKIKRIIQLGCTHFIDDLEETFLEKTFPVFVQKILFAPFSNTKSKHGWNVYTSWENIYAYFSQSRN